MNILMISTNRNQYPMPVIPIGACMVAEAARRAGHDVTFLDLMFARNPVTAIRHGITRSAPDVIGLSVRNIDNNDMQAPVFFIKDLLPLFDTIRSMTPATIVLGGAAVAVMPEALLRATGVSLAVTGDGETVFPLLLDSLSQQRSPEHIPGVAWIRDKVFHANPCYSSASCHNCSPPDYGRWITTASYVSRLSTVPVQTKLGCHFRCVYCTYRKIEGSRYRLSEPEAVVDAIGALASGGLRHIEFVDNVFNSPYDHALSLCEMLAGADLDASLQSLELNPLYIDDRLITAMERAGFSGMGITVESASDRVLEGLGKGFTSEHVYHSAEVVRRHALPCVWIFMLGGPGETEETVNETLRFAEKHIRPQDVAFFGSGIRIYPGTELETIARNQGLLSLPAGEMLEPVFYNSPDVDYPWMQKRIKGAMADNMHFISSGSLGLPFLPLIHRLGYRFGLRPPLWKHTRFIRRSLRMIGIDA